MKVAAQGFCAVRVPARLGLSPLGQVLGLATVALKKPEHPVWLPKKSTLCGPPDELSPLDLDDAGLPSGLEAIDEDLSEPFFDELPADDRAG